jgi:hypothetical protein
LAALVEYRGIIALAKSAIKSAIVLDHSAIDSELKKLSDLTKIQRKAFE